MGRAPGRRESILVVGGGLTGAALAWVATRAGKRVLLVTEDRPATHTTALAPGVVCGVGVPGPAVEWISLSSATLTRIATRRRVGRAMLSDVLLAAERPSGLALLRHVLMRPVELSGAELSGLVRRLAGHGFSIGIDAGRIINPRDGVVRSRRLTLEMLRQSRAAGADLRLASGLLGLDPQATGPIEIDLRGVSERFDRVFWATGCPASGGPGAERFITRTVLHQSLEMGVQVLDATMQAADGRLLLAPDPSRVRRLVLVRLAHESAGGRVSWPAPPDCWGPFLGPVRRSTLTEISCGPADRVFDPGGRVVSMTGFGTWPVADVLGACVEAVGATD